jgi:hypothetical protein
MELKDIANVFVRLSKNQLFMVQKAERDRKRIADQLEDDITPTGIRVDWIRTVATKIITLFEESSHEFQRQHPGNIILIKDYGDVLATVMAWIKAAGVTKGNALGQPPAPPT